MGDILTWQHCGAQFWFYDFKAMENESYPGTKIHPINLSRHRETENWVLSRRLHSDYNHKTCTLFFFSETNKTSIFLLLKHRCISAVKLLQRSFIYSSMLPRICLVSGKSLICLVSGQNKTDGQLKHGRHVIQTYPNFKASCTTLPGIDNVLTVW